MSDRKLRTLVAKPGPDGPDRGARVVDAVGLSIIDRVESYQRPKVA